MQVQFITNHIFQHGLHKIARFINTRLYFLCIIVGYMLFARSRYSIVMLGDCNTLLQQFDLFASIRYELFKCTDLWNNVWIWRRATWRKDDPTLHVQAAWVLVWRQSIQSRSIGQSQSEYGKQSSRFVSKLEHEVEGFLCICNIVMTFIVLVICVLFVLYLYSV